MNDHDRGAPPVTRRVIIIAGPNGTGKTTFAREYLPHEAGCPNFINADLIADGISPLNPPSAAIRAAELMLEEIHRCVQRRESFAFETTLSGRTYAQRIPMWQNSGYRVDLSSLSCGPFAWPFLAYNLGSLTEATTCRHRWCGGGSIVAFAISRNSIAPS